MPAYRWPGLLLLATFILATPRAWAQSSLTLADAIAIALRTNPQLTAAERQVDAAKAREVQAAAWPNPNLSLNADEVPLPTPIQGIYTAGISQPLLVGGQLEARKAAAKADTLMADIGVAILRRDLTAQVKDTYMQLLYENAGVTLARTSRDTAALMAKATQRRLEVGEVARIDMLRADVELSRTEREVMTAENQVRQVAGKLNTLLGRPAQTAIGVADLPVVESPRLPSASDLVAAALASRPEVRQAAAGIERESWQRRLAQTGIWTGTEANLAVGAIGGQFGVSTSVRLPIPVYRQQGEIAEADANRLRAEAQATALRNDITLDVEQAYRDAVVDADQVRLYRQSYLPQAERLVDLAQRRFAVGEGSGIEVMEARRAWRDVQAEYARALLAFRRAMVSLERATGLDLLPTAPNH
jgi:cobalt-zinc-cadmium efflux system outer membrane protein